MLNRNLTFRVAALSAILATFASFPTPTQASTGHFSGNLLNTGLLYWNNPSNWFEGVVGYSNVVINALPYDGNTVYFGEGGAGMNNLSILRGDWRFIGSRNGDAGMNDLAIGDLANPDSKGDGHAKMTFDVYGDTVSPGFSAFGSPGNLQVLGTTYVGKSAGSNGTLTLIKSGEDPAMAANTMWVGYFGDGTVNIDHSSLQYTSLLAGFGSGTTGNIVADGAPYLVYHDTNGGLASYSVTVAYPTWEKPNSYGETDIGGMGDGGLTLKNGATGRLGWLTVGDIEGGVGRVSLLNGSFATTTRADIGYGGEAHLTVSHSTFAVALNPFYPHGMAGEGNFSLNGVGNVGGTATADLVFATLNVAGSVLVNRNSAFIASNGSVVSLGVTNGVPSRIPVPDPSFTVNAYGGQTSSATFDASTLNLGHSGTLNVGRGTTIPYGDTYDMATFTAQNGSRVVGKSLTVLGGEADFLDSGTTADFSGRSLVGDKSGNYSGSLAVAYGAEASFGSELKTGEFGIVSVVPGGAITVGNGSGNVQAGHIEVGSGGALGGTGTFIGDVDVNGGMIDPGFSPGVTHIDGDFTMTDGTIIFQIGGLIRGLEYDGLDVTGSLDITGGTIEFDSYDAWVAPTGSIFDFFNAGSLHIGPGVTILNATGSPFAFDRLTGIGSAQAVPEPASLAALALGALGFVYRRRR